MLMNPATRIIDMLGGPQAVAERRGVVVQTVYRWRLPKARGGTGGRIPTEHCGPMLKDAKARQLPLTADDFLEAPSAAPPKTGGDRNAA